MRRNCIDKRTEGRLIERQSLLYAARSWRRFENRVREIANAEGPSVDGAAETRRGGMAAELCAWSRAAFGVGEAE